MTIGAALLLIAVGAILRFAVSTVSAWGVDLHTIGDILMVVGVVGLLLWLFIWGPWARGRRNRGYPRRPPDDVPPEGYRDGYRDGRYDRYPSDDPTAEYPNETVYRERHDRYR